MSSTDYPRTPPPDDRGGTEFSGSHPDEEDVPEEDLPVDEEEDS
jgi:hypothetical protein